MAQKTVVHIVGTGTIGEPLIGLFAEKKEALGFDEVTFHKRTPLLTDRSKVTNLIKRGARLVCDESARRGFRDFGIEPFPGTRITSVLIEIVASTSIVHARTLITRHGSVARSVRRVAAALIECISMSGRTAP